MEMSKRRVHKACSAAELCVWTAMWQRAAIRLESAVRMNVQKDMCARMPLSSSIVRSMSAWSRTETLAAIQERIVTHTRVQQASWRSSKRKVSFATPRTAPVWTLVPVATNKANAAAFYVASALCSKQMHQISHAQLPSVQMPMKLFAAMLEHLAQSSCVLRVSLPSPALRLPCTAPAQAVMRRRIPRLVAKNERSVVHTHVQRAMP
mmetsp:Transcript_27433/g.63393  ORF Transcript_27433/g.63393 Transcript_27433/m.63393 type:complete len:207 (+) Transcript_27433:1476-2096(+)